MTHLSRYLAFVVETLAADSTISTIVGVDSQKGVYKSAAPQRDAASNATPKLPYIVCHVPDAPATNGNGGVLIATRPRLIVRIYGGTGENRKDAADQVASVLSAGGTRDGASIAAHVLQGQTSGQDAIPGEPAVPFEQLTFLGFVTG